MLQLIPTAEVEVGDRIMPEEYDDHVSLADYDECSAEEVVSVDRVDMYQVRITTAYETATFDRDDLQMVVKRGAWQRDGRDTTDLS